MLLTATPPKVHAPPVFGEPVNLVKRSTAGPLLHVLKVPFPPAETAGFTETVSVAVALGHGAVPGTV